MLFIGRYESLTFIEAATRSAATRVTSHNRHATVIKRLAVSEVCRWHILIQRLGLSNSPADLRSCGVLGRLGDSVADIDEKSDTTSAANPHDRLA